MGQVGDRWTHPELAGVFPSVFGFHVYLVLSGPYGPLCCKFYSILCFYLFLHYFSLLKMLITVLVIGSVMVRSKSLARSSLEDCAAAATCSALGSGRDSFSGIRAWFENRARRQRVFKMTFGFHGLIK